MRTFLVASILALTVAVAYAQLGGFYGTHQGPVFDRNDHLGMGLGSYYGTGGAPPPSCSNSLDFTDSCNSQYIGVL